MLLSFLPIRQPQEQGGTATRLLPDGLDTTDQVGQGPGGDQGQDAVCVALRTQETQQKVRCLDGTQWQGK